VCARIKEAYLKIVLGDRALLPDHLVEPLTRHDAHAVGVDVCAMTRAWRRTINRNLESDRLTVRSRPQNKVKVAGAESVNDATAWLFKDCVLVVNGWETDQPARLARPERRVN